MNMVLDEFGHPLVDPSSPPKKADWMRVGARVSISHPAPFQKYLKNARGVIVSVYSPHPSVPFGRCGWVRLDNPFFANIPTPFADCPPGSALFYQNELTREPGGTF